MTRFPIAILHYASPPTIGGVESTIAHQASTLHAVGFPVRVISGSGGPFHPDIECVIDPLFGSRHPRVLAAKHALDRGAIPSGFDALVGEIAERLGAALVGCHAVIVHNVHTLHKNLALTAALHTLRPPPHVLAWVHDLAWENPGYASELHSGYPWHLLRTPWPDTRYVTISEPQRDALSALTGLPADAIAVIPPGLDIPAFQGWTPHLRDLAADYGWLDADRLLLLPARLTRRKNIAAALHILRALRDLTGGDDRLIVTGPPGPHNPANPGYLDELLALRSALGLDDAAHFLYAWRDPPVIPDDATMANLFHLADALIFPSTSEGFGIPILEAGLAGLPIFAADLPVFHDIAGDDFIAFDPVTTHPHVVALAIRSTLDRDSRLRRHIRRSYRWDALIRRHLVPILEAL